MLVIEGIGSNWRGRFWCIISFFGEETEFRFNFMDVFLLLMKATSGCEQGVVVVSAEFEDLVKSVNTEK